MRLRSTGFIVNWTFGISNTSKRRSSTTMVRALWHLAGSTTGGRNQTLATQSINRRGPILANAVSESELCSWRTFDSEAAAAAAAAVAASKADAEEAEPDTPFQDRRVLMHARRTASSQHQPTNTLHHVDVRQLAPTQISLVSPNFRRARN